MKKKLIFFTLVLSTLISLQYAAGPADQNNQGYTGAPGESGLLCGSCHTGGPYGVASAILEISDGGGMIVDSYVPGETYQVSLTAIAESGSPSGYGFQLTVLDDQDNDLAVLSNPSANAQISIASNVAGGRTYAEHDGTSATNTFTFDWQAPVEGSGDMTFYYNVNLVNGTGGTSGDNGGNGFSATMSESTPPVVKVIGELEINNAYTFPTEDGTANQVLTTDGAGVVSWADPQASFIAGNTASQNLRNAGNRIVENSFQKKEIDQLKNEVVLLKEEIEALKRMIQTLSEKSE